MPGSTSLLDSQRCLKFSGLDAETFLQGQFTNDLTTLATGDQQLNGYCNPKGRALCVFRLAREGDQWLMFLPANLVDNIQKRLTLYRMRAKVSIEALDDHYIFGLINPDSAGGEVIAANRHWRVDQHRTLVLSTELLDTNSGESSWTTAEILSGTPDVTAETAEQFIPQHINLDLAGGVSFSKGCYPGQEIVARLRYLGKMKQRMIGGWCAWSDSAPAPLPGTPLFARGAEERKIGQVVRASVFEGRCFLLLNVPASLIDQGDLMLVGSEGMKIERFPLPYRITLGKE